jgi:hypothetical protein
MLIFMWAFFILLPVVFTWWGWKNVLFPIGIPLLKYTFVLLLFLVWFGICSAIMASPTWYRTFGWNTFTVAAESDPDSYGARDLLWTQENSVTPEGAYEPNWRTNRGLRPLSPSWHGQPEPEHKLPGWTAIFIPLGIIGLMWARNARLARRIKDDGGRDWASIHADMARIEAEVSGFHPKLLPSQPVDITPAKSSDDADFKAALKGLGYKDRDISRVMQQCREPTIEARIRHALQILVNT